MHSSHTSRTAATVLYRTVCAIQYRISLGHTVLVIAYHLLKECTIYTNLGGDDFEKRDHPAVGRRIVCRLEGLVYTVSLAPGWHRLRPRHSHWGASGDLHRRSDLVPT